MIMELYVYTGSTKKCSAWRSGFGRVYAPVTSQITQCIIGTIGKWHENETCWTRTTDCVVIIFETDGTNKIRDSKGMGCNRA
jgi:hypothetical protein